MNLMSDAEEHFKKALRVSAFFGIYHSCCVPDIQIYFISISMKANTIKTCYEHVMNNDLFYFCLQLSNNQCDVYCLAALNLAIIYIRNGPARAQMVSKNE